MTTTRPRNDDLDLVADLPDLVPLRLSWEAAHHELPALELGDDDDPSRLSQPQRRYLGCGDRRCATVRELLARAWTAGWRAGRQAALAEARGIVDGMVGPS